MAEATPLKGDAVVIGEAPKKWRHGLCDCCGDCMVCCAVCCCNAVTTGQIYEKAVRANLINRIAGMGCMAVFLLLVVCYAAHDILQAAGGYYMSDFTLYWDPDTNSWTSMKDDGTTMESTPWQAQAAEFFLFVASIVTCCIVCNVRKAIRTRDQIKPTCCPDCCDDACCTMFCGACTECLILRHEGVTSQKYSLCSPIAVKV